MTATDPAKLAVDIGGTFTDVALESGGRLYTAKTLTTPRAPETAVLEGIARVLEQAGLTSEKVGLLIHGTTLATNALIERKGARTALLVTEGFRDSLEMAYENRFEQYDVNIDRPEPLVPRYLRLPVRERISAAGETLIPLDEAALAETISTLVAQEVESIAVGLLHAYAWPAHEDRVGAILAEALPGVPVSLSSAVCPEIREYERQSTTAANAYVQPLMARYLTQLDHALRARGFRCPFLLITSGGGLTDLATAVRFPIRLVESGPAGGAILAGRIAAELGLDRVVSYDMGGTTAKICLIDDLTPLTSRTFEVARVYRFRKGSGLPIRVPVIEMVEIGAGGGSIARVDSLGRVQVGPDSTSSEPGPACYGRGGERATVTDADLALGRIDPVGFAGGGVTLNADAGAAALNRDLGEALGLTDELAAFALAETVDENMANAARVHAVEWGKDISQRDMIAFGGAAPLHAARLAEKLDLRRIVVPTDAGVGSAIGFLKAPVAFEVVRSRYLRLAAFDAALANALLAEMREEALATVRQAAPEADLVGRRQAFMRYLGQGHEIAVDLPAGDLEDAHREVLATAFAQAYTQLYGRTIPNLDVEILSWTLTLGTAIPEIARLPSPTASDLKSRGASPNSSAHERRSIFDPGLGRQVEAAVHRREELAPGSTVAGPALIVEAQTTTVVSASFDAAINAVGYIVMTRKPGQGEP